MNKFLLALTVSAMAFSMAACNPVEEVKKGTEEVKKVIDVKTEVTKYVDERNVLVEKQVTQITRLEEDFLMVEDYEESFNNLSTVIIPEFKVFLDEVLAISYKTPEVQMIHQSFSDAMQLQYDILLGYEEAMINEDDELFAEADAKVDEMNAMLTQNEKDFMQLAEEYRVILEWEE